MKVVCLHWFAKSHVFQLIELCETHIRKDTQDVTHVMFDAAQFPTHGTCYVYPKEITSTLTDIMTDSPATLNQRHRWNLKLVRAFDRFVRDSQLLESADIIFVDRCVVSNAWTLLGRSKVCVLDTFATFALSEHPTGTCMAQMVKSAVERKRLIAFGTQAKYLVLGILILFTVERIIPSYCFHTFHPHLFNNISTFHFENKLALSIGSPHTLELFQLSTYPRSKRKLHKKVSYVVYACPGTEQLSLDFTEQKWKYKWIAAVKDLLMREQVSEVHFSCAGVPDNWSELQSMVDSKLSVHAWTNQREMLKRCDIFVTHGGTGSIKDATDTCTPCLFLPCTFDQESNADTMQCYGLGQLYSSTAVDEVLLNYSSFLLKLQSCLDAAEESSKCEALSLCKVLTTKTSSRQNKGHLLCHKLIINIVWLHCHLFILLSEACECAVRVKKLLICT
mmetsp:Transcript_4007/g.14013  ORF Transcript_4007/g.14013 Transcript_4007/m.14013 type:complete len:448 (-) Transcript_4007:82-1425(-)